MPEAPAAHAAEAPADDGSKKRALEEAAAEEPAAKQAKVEAVPAPTGPRVRKNLNHPAARAMRRARKATRAPEPEVLFPVGTSPADLHIQRSLRTATPRRPRSSRAAWGRLKQVCACPAAAACRRCASAGSDGNSVQSSGPFSRPLLTCALHLPSSPHPQAAHGTLPLGSKRSKNVFWSGAVEEAAAASSSSEEEEEEEER